ncbi:Fic family protein [Candidatus Dependentiae bacterium]
MQAFQELLQAIDKKKKKLDSFRPLPKALVKNLSEWFKVELTYSSNAIEGNTLTKSETAMVVEKGLTIKGKSVNEHLEAVNHAFALDFVKELATKKKEDITLADILDIHLLVLRSIDDKNSGRLRSIAVRISGSDVALPDPIQVSDLMRDFVSWLHKTDEHPVKIAADAHFKLIAIHPFVDGNGRTARLLMNLILISYGYPPAVIEPEERKEYIAAIEKAQKTGDMSDFYVLVAKAVEKSLDMYIDAAEKSL